MAFPSVDPSAFGAMPAALSQGFTMPTGGMFGGGGNDKLKQALLAAVAGFMARRSPGVSSNIIGGLQDAQTLKQRLAMAQQERQQQMQDQRDEFTFEQDYKQAHPGTPDIQERIAVLNGIKPGLGDTYAQNYAQNGGGLGPVLTNPITGQTMVPAAKAPAAEPPAEAIARLKANPAEASQFDEIFGPGASAKILGGPTPSASGVFPQAPGGGY